jgi:hypothetical protein
MFGKDRVGKESGGPHHFRDAERVRALLELIVEKMKLLETELVAYAAVFLSLQKTLNAGPELAKLLDEARNNADFRLLIEEKYAPFSSALERSNQDSLLEMLKNWKYDGLRQ